MFFVMAGLVPGIRAATFGVDGRHQAGHDGWRMVGGRSRHLDDHGG
jgi:hypothetical protein